MAEPTVDSGEVVGSTPTASSHEEDAKCLGY
jgi:hypothetical protein